MLSRLKLKRMARRLIWPRPGLYFPFGILRNRGNVFRSDFQLYISGLPRSGNTFAVKAFLSANPGTPLHSHKHIPAFIIQSMKRQTPGMVLLRNPLDAAISWTIFTKLPLRETLAYYNDFYSVLLPHRDSLFFVSFEDVITDFGKVITAFNSQWGTDYLPFQHTPENTALCMKQIEAEYLDASGQVIESRVPRPSVRRKLQKETLLRQVDHSPVLQKELGRAKELYCLLAPGHFMPKRPRHGTNSTQSIRLRPI